MKNSRCMVSFLSCCSMALPFAAVAGAIDDLNAKGFAWDVFDETTGFVVHTSDDPYAAYSGKAWYNNWSTGNAPESGTNYYSAGKLLYAPKMDSGGHPVFAGDLLVLDSAFRMMQASRYLTFTDFVGLSGGKILVGSTGEGIITSGEMHFRTDGESPFAISQNALFENKAWFFVKSGGKLSSTPETVLSLTEESKYISSNKWWHFTISVTSEDASDFTGKLYIPDAGLKLKAAEFGGEVEMTNRWVDVGFHPVEGYAITNTPGVFVCGADDVVPKIRAVTLRRGTQMDITGGDCIVGDLKVCGADLIVDASQSQNDGGMLTVTNSMAIEGKMRIVNIASAWDSIDGDPAAIPVLRFAADVDLTGVDLDDFVIASTPNCDSSLGTFPVQRLELRSCGDGSSELCITRNKIVRNVYVPSGGDRSWTFGSDDAKEFWEDGEIEHSGVDYHLGFNGRAPQYWIESNTVFPTENFLFNNGEMFLKTEYAYFTNLVVAGEKASLAAKTTDGVDILDGLLGMFGSPFDLSSAANMTLDIRSEVYGNGIISFKGTGVKKLSGHNDRFSGRIKFASGAVCRLFFGYGDSLGGASDSFMYNAVTIAEGASIVPMCDIVLSEPTRGLFVSGKGAVDVPVDTTLEVWSIVTYGGTLEKTGDGVLALVQKPRFIDGMEETEPLEGTNVLMVSAGVVKTLSQDSLNGLSVAFSAETELRIPHMPGDLDFRNKGIAMTLGLSSIAVPDSGLTVRFDTEADFAEEFEQGVATFATEAEAEAFANGISLRPRPSGFAYRKAVVESDGAFTVVASLKKIGFAISIR